MLALLSIMDKKKLFRLVLITISFVGFIVASIALYYHFDSSGEAFCDVSDRFNCSVVYSSQYSYIMGVPVPIFGMFGYFFLIMAILNQKRFASMLAFSQKEYWGYGAIIAGFMFLFQSILTIVSSLIIQSYCILCLISQGVITSVCIGIIIYWKSLKK